MHELHMSGTAAGVLFAAGLVGYTAGLLIAILLLGLSLRARKLPGAPAASVVFAVCALLWCGGGLANAAVRVTGAGSARLAQGIQFAAAAAFPVLILTAWNPFAEAGWPRTLVRYLTLAAGISGVAIVAALFSGANARPLVTYNAALFLSAGAAIALRRQTAPDSVYLPSLVMAAGAVAALWTQWAVAPVGLCAFFLFARFRYADVFFRYTVRILLAATIALALALSTSLIVVRIQENNPPTPAFHVFGIALISGVLMVLFAFADEPLHKRVSRWLFHAPDYRGRLRELGEKLQATSDESEIGPAVEDSTRDTLAVESARLIAADAFVSPAFDSTLNGDILELDAQDPLRGRLPAPGVELIVPVSSAGKVTHALLVAPGSHRPMLVSNDLNFLRAAAVQCGHRLDSLRAERESVERQSREALLLQQVTEAQLRALRAQVNPHFLFNSLNTVADLIVRDPQRAEEMTLRLAEVFRHVLAHSSRSLTSVNDEVEFLRTYLYIEEARFRDRLTVRMEVAPEVGADQIPSLILQPLVENALKHGLGPKPGPGNLWISAGTEGSLLRLRVEDDGMGPNGHAAARGTGLGNVAERLRTLYREEASLMFEARPTGGSRVTLRLPRT